MNYEMSGAKTKGMFGDKAQVFLFTSLVVMLDQVTKYLATAFIPESTIAVNGAIPVIPEVFNLVLTFNKGAAFGIFGQIANDTYRHLVLGAAILCALGSLWFFLREFGRTFLGRLALALILGGAIGNVIDRVRVGAVIDFLDFYRGSYHWPAFNIADSCICVGVGLVIFFHPSQKQDQKRGVEHNQGGADSNAEIGS